MLFSLLSDVREIHIYCATEHVVYGPGDGLRGGC